MENLKIGEEKIYLDVIRSLQLVTFEANFHDRLFMLFDDWGIWVSHEANEDFQCAHIIVGH